MVDGMLHHISFVLDSTVVKTCWCRNSKSALMPSIAFYRRQFPAPASTSQGEVVVYCLRVAQHIACRK